MGRLESWNGAAEGSLPSPAGMVTLHPNGRTGGKLSHTAPESPTGRRARCTVVRPIPPDLPSAALALAAVAHAPPRTNRQPKA